MKEKDCREIKNNVRTEIVVSHALDLMMHDTVYEDCGTCMQTTTAVACCGVFKFYVVHKGKMLYHLHECIAYHQSS